MWGRMAVFCAVFCAVFGGVVGCRGADQTAPSPRDVATTVDRAASVRAPIASYDELEALDLADGAFGGFYWDGDQLVLMSTNPGSAASTMARLGQSDLATGVRGVAAALTDGRVAVRSAQFRFHTLADAFRAAYRTHPHFVVFLDIDERANRLVLGVRTGTPQAAVEGWLTPLHLPDGSTVVRYSDGFTHQTSLTDRVRPTRGGFRVQSLHKSGCSLGINLDTDLGRGFMTASHCTMGFATLDYDLFYQASIPLNLADSLTSSNLVGSELVDPALTDSGATCSAPVGCRWSDAAFIAYDDSSDGARGLIARTTNSSGSTTIDASNPNFTVSSAAETSVLSTGDSVNKVGEIGGWTHGEVTATCVTMPDWEPDIDLRCQWLADYNSSSGDSGGPVFTWSGSGSNVTLVGIHVGVYYTGDAIYTAWKYVYLEFGFDLGAMDPTY